VVYRDSLLGDYCHSAAVFDGLGQCFNAFRCGWTGDERKLPAEAASAPGAAAPAAGGAYALAVEADVCLLL
jgi:hypothetical protein